MGLGLSQDMGFHQSLLQYCSCCEQDMNGDPMKEGVLIEYLNSCEGKDMRYRLCPNCFQSVPESLWTPKYKRLWTIKAKKLVAKGAKIPTGPFIHFFVWDPDKVAQNKKQAEQVNETFKKAISEYGPDWEI